MAASVAAYYEVQWRLKLSGSAWSASYRVNPTSEIVVKGLGRAQDYEFRVRSVSSCGARSIWVGSDYTVPDAPPPPPVLTPPVGSGHSDGVSIDWGDGSVPPSGVMYQVDRAPAVAPYASSPPPEGDASWVRVATVSATNWTDSLTDTANYWYRVRAVSYTGATSAWTVLNAPLQATVSTVDLQTEVNQQFTQLQADTAGLRNDVDTTIAQVQTLQGQVGDILQADVWSSATTYAKGELVQYNGQLFRSLIDGNLNHQPTASTTDANWEYIGNYASLGEAVGATAANVATLQNTVTQQGNTITANSQSITQNAAAIGTKADASALTATNATVTQQGNSITANAADIALLGAHTADKSAFVLNQNSVQVGGGQTFAQMLSGLQAGTAAVNARVDSEQTARANGDAANASAITAVQASTNAVNKNWCTNPNADTGTSSWITFSTENGAVFGTASWTQGNIFVFSQSVSGGYTWFEFDWQPPYTQAPWTAGCELSVQGLGAGSYVYHSLVALDASGNSLQEKTSALFQNGNYSRLNNSFASMSAPPAGTVKFRYAVVLYGTATQVTFRAVKIENSGSPTAFTVDGMAAQSASATQSLTAGTTINGIAYAAATTMVDANGRIGGTRLASNGAVSSFTVVADQFAVVAPNGGARLEWSGGNQRVYDANNVLRVRMGVW